MLSLDLLFSKRKKAQGKDMTVVKKNFFKGFPCLEVVRQPIGLDHRDMGLEIRVGTKWGPVSGKTCMKW